MEQSWLIWTISIAIGFPVIMIALGELTFFLEKNQHPLVELVKIFRTWVLPSLTAFFLLEKVFKLPEKTIFYQLVETFFWITLVYWGLTLFNTIVFQKARQGSWRAKVPKIFLDLSRTFLVLIGAAIVLSSVWDADLGGLLTALGVGSLVIGLALQDSLGNIFSGMALLFEQPLAIGDWVQVGDVDGQVKEITWRSVHICNRQQDLVIIPNSELAKGNFKNYSRPQSLHAVNVDIKFAVDAPPNKVIEMLKKTALETIGVLKEPSPKILLTSLDDYFLMYRTIFFVDNYPQGIESNHEFQLRVWYVSQRYNITMPFPTSIEYGAEIPVAENYLDKALEVLQKSSDWETIEREFLGKICQQSTVEYYAKQETILEKDTQIKGLFVIVEGQVSLLYHDDDYSHNCLVLGYLSPGEFFGGQAALMKEENSDLTVKALVDTKVLVIPQNILLSTIEQFPTLANKIGEVMELRRQQIKALKRYL